MTNCAGRIDVVSAWNNGRRIDETNMRQTGLFGPVLLEFGRSLNGTRANKRSSLPVSGWECRTSLLGHRVEKSWRHYHFAGCCRADGAGDDLLRRTRPTQRWGFVRVNARLGQWVWAVGVRRRHGTSETNKIKATFHRQDSGGHGH
jgi:hypothetical protein